MNLSALPASDLQELLETKGISISIGPFKVNLQSRLEAISSNIRLLYADYEISDVVPFHDFHIRICAPRNLRRWIRPQAIFEFDGRQPFKPLPYSQAYPFFEWGLNWCVAQHAHQYLIVHAAVVEKGGLAAVLPGAPGSGKSTLCASLVNRGWRLLTDELAMIDPASGQLIPVPRPVSLKNGSIDVIKGFAPDAVIGPLAEDTAKGTVAHMKPPRDSVFGKEKAAAPAWVVFPDYAAGKEATLESHPKSRGFIRIVEHAFNYHVLGLIGFQTLTALIDSCDCFTFRYSRLEDAIRTFDKLFQESKPHG